MSTQRPAQPQQTIGAAEPQDEYPTAGSAATTIGAAEPQDEYLTAGSAATDNRVPRSRDRDQGGAALFD